MCACSAPAEAFDVVQCAMGRLAAAFMVTGVLMVELSVVVPAVSVVFAAVHSVPVENPRDHPPAHVPIVVVTRPVALITVERVGTFMLPRFVFAPVVLSVTMPGSIFHQTNPPLFKEASLMAS